MNKFEQLIEYVINDEEAKARELFHDIVVEKSRAIYEEMMEEETVEESEEQIDEESTHDEDDKAEKAGRKVTKDIEYDDKKDKMDESEEAVAEDLGGDQADDLIDDIEVEEEGLSMEGEGSDDMGEEMADADIEDRVVDLEDKLDELMAEFEALMGDQGEADVDTEMDMEVDSDDGMTDIEVADDEMETEGMMKMPMEEAINLKAAPAPVKSEEAGVNKKSTVAANSGAVGAAAQPVKMTGDVAQGRPAPSTKDLIGKVQNTPAQSTVKQEPATKPHLAQATGVNTKTPFPKQ
jgi:hypothetical protein